MQQSTKREECHSVQMCAFVLPIESTHVHPLCGVDEARHPGTDVQLHTNNWDETQKPDILDHAGPLRQLYSLNLENANLAEDHRGLDNLMCGLCMCLCVYVRGKGGSRWMQCLKNARKCVKKRDVNSFNAICLQMYLCK